MNLEFSHIAHVYGQGATQTRALEDISFAAPAGKITCLLGASGCGKSTLLGLAAGLLQVQQGQVLVNGQVLAQSGLNPPPEARPVGMVFQDGALFPHMTIAKNVAFGMSNDTGSAVEQWLARVGLGGMGGRYPHELSGGQQQRAALARAMAPNPQVLLMDEPFASVDIVLRRRLRRDCRLLLRERGTTTVLVTHDPEEALDIADQIAVMQEGRIIQFGTPAQLYDAPAAPTVGAIFGGAQVVRAHWTGDAFVTSFGEWPIECAQGAAPDTKGAVDVLVQARALRLKPDQGGVIAHDLHPMGARVRVLLRDAGGGELTAELPSAAVSSITAGERYSVVPDAESLRVFAV